VGCGIWDSCEYLREAGFLANDAPTMADGSGDAFDGVVQSESVFKADKGKNSC